MSVSTITRYHYGELHGQYHPQGKIYDKYYRDEIHKPPNFGFNGNHIYFAGRNYYILDGHHKAVAYDKLGKNPNAIIIECLSIEDGSYPSK